MRLLILGVGSPLMGDDGFGVAVVRELSKGPLPEGVAAVDGGTAGFGLSDLIAEAEEAFIIDAADMGRVPGKIEEFTPDQVRSLTADHQVSLHQSDVLSVLRVLTELGSCPPVTILAVQPARVAQDIGFSPEVAAAIPVALQRVRERLARLDARSV
jgi:hydrogenase maturation protease